MRRPARALLLATIGVVLLASGGGPRAAEVEKKWRVGFVVGGYNTQDRVRSQAANQMILVDETERIRDIINDPRNDSAAIGDLKIEPTVRATVSGQYAFNRFFIMEASIGYQEGDLGDVEMQAQFQGQVIEEPNQPFLFNVYRFAAGSVTQIPIQVTAISRFRPKAKFNPYMGAGVGYTLVDFQPSDALNQISRNMDNSRGIQSSVGQSAAVPLGDLTGASVEDENSFEWHLVGGAEFSIKQNWAIVLDLRWTWASRALRLRFNGVDSLGISVPNGPAEITSSIATGVYGPVFIQQGGLVDMGRQVPGPLAPENPPSTFCETDPQLCIFEFSPDGVPDPGLYYVQGGRIEYGGPSWQVGFRYTF